MATKVSSTGKDGKISSVTFPTRGLAERYAGTLKGHVTLEDTDAVVAPVEVKVGPEATAELQRSATNTYFRSVKEPVNGRIVATYTSDVDSEAEAERMAEHFGAARAAGQSQEDAWSDWDYVSGRA